MKHGTFIVLEGGDGAGKTTVANALKEALSSKEFLFTRAGGSPFGEKLRALLVSDEGARASLESRFALAFALGDCVQSVIKPALVVGKHVISDRFDASIFAYQVYAEEQLHLADLFWLARKELFSATVPDLYIFLDVDVQKGFERVRQKGKPLDHFEKRPLSFQERVRGGYQEFFKQVPHVVVDANRPLQEVQKEVLEVVQKHL
ncbi:MAG: dTMP kinase [Candidatus Taylorbacteria bacterium]|nr:dTMP kinase [Candidatus Taylorbacteria bacterium]